MGRNKEEIEEEWYAEFPSLKLHESENEGRYLQAKRDIKKGEIVLIGKPYIWVINEEFKEETCRFCVKTFTDKRICCKLCQEVYYCSASCQKCDAEEHFALECRLLYEVFTKNRKNNTFNFEESLFTEMKLLVRMLSRKRVEQMKAQVEGADEKSKQLKFAWEKQRDYNDYKFLVAGVSEYPDQFIQSVKYWISSYILQLLRYFNQLKNLPIENVESEEEIIEIICRNRRNTFSFGNGEESNPQSSGLYILPSLFNHSCSPNVYIRIPRYSLDFDVDDNDDNENKFDNRSQSLDGMPFLIFCASRDINQGETLTISYISSGVEDEDAQEDIADYKLRQRELMDHYLFLCACPKCQHQSSIHAAVTATVITPPPPSITTSSDIIIDDKGSVKNDNSNNSMNDHHNSGFNSNNLTMEKIEGCFADEAIISCHNDDSKVGYVKLTVNEGEDELKNESNNEVGSQIKDCKNEEAKDMNYPHVGMIGRCYKVNIHGKDAIFKVVGFSIETSEDEVDDEGDKEKNESIKPSETSSSQSEELVSSLFIHVLTSKTPRKKHTIPYSDFISLLGQK